MNFNGISNTDDSESKIQVLDLQTQDYTSLNEELQKMDNFTASTATDTNLTGILNTDDITTDKIYDKSKAVSIELDTNDISVTATNFIVNGDNLHDQISILENKCQNIIAQPLNSALTRVIAQLQCSQLNTSGIRDLSLTAGILLDSTSVNVDAGSLRGSGSIGTVANPWITGHISTLNATSVFTGTIECQNLVLISDQIALGPLSGETNQGSGSVAVGPLSGQTNQNTNCVAIGYRSGNDTQGVNSVAIGNSAGQTTQGNRSVAIGINTANNDQGDDSVAIGNTAGETTQGIGSVAIGAGAGNDDQKANSVAIGITAGQTTQGIGSVAIGADAGKTTQGTFSVAIGTNAGVTTQGNFSVALGTSAGQTNQHNNSIVLNGSGVALNTTSQNSLYIKPIRSATNEQFLKYNTTSGEITYEEDITGCIPPLTMSSYTYNADEVKNT